MATLILEDSSASGEASIGGVPYAPAGTKWPTCRQCEKPMQFLAQLPLDGADSSLKQARGKVLMLFQCQNDPGMCDEWDANSGGNAALLTAADGRESMVVPPGETLLPAVSRVKYLPYDDSVQVESDDDNFCAALDDHSSKTLGKLGGRPLWIQGEETPQCNCGKTMLFVAQLESAGGGGINFGDAGVGYAFVCTECDSAKFLWQCG
jgi:hypothetical protein